ncbi:MAG: pirin family protein, partial [Acidimicrobiales bacterium]
GFETLTMMFEGVMNHLDSTGFGEHLPSGSTQNMVAGRGIQHGGDMAADPDTHTFHEVQLWVTMPAATKMDPPSIESVMRHDKPHIDLGHHTIEVITGSVDGQSSPLRTTQPTRVLRIETSGPGPIVISDIDPDWNAIVYVLRGAVHTTEQRVEAYSTIVFAGDGDTIELQADDQPSEMLVLTGLPTDEPIAMGGPWVMNTKDELRQAQADFEAGLF